MIKFPALISSLVIICQGIVAQQYEHFRVDDGPHIIRKEKKNVIKWVESGYCRTKVLSPDVFAQVKDKFNLQFSYRDINSTFNSRPEIKFAYRGVDSTAVISDIHGHYEKYLKLLKAQNILDKNNNWSYGKGHLVILGDCLDRGSQVTELLWHLYGLEKQAEKAGGMVHVLLGNHEIMVLGEDIRYVHDKYMHVQSLMGIKYTDLFSSETMLGIWLRHKPVTISVNDVIFVHGGISPELIRRKIPPEEINHLFYQMDIARQVESQNDLENLFFLTEDHGPLWYRGYFDDTALTEMQADSILNYFNKKHIVVGHTPSEDFQTRFGKKIIGIDAGLGNKMDGALLLINRETFYKATADGKREKF